MVTCPLVPDVPHLRSGSCTSPRSFELGFLQTPPRDDALALLLTFGSTNTWYGDFHPTSSAPCLAHTTLFGFQDGEDREGQKRGEEDPGGQPVELRLPREHQKGRERQGGEPSVGNVNQPYSSHSWFPCKDHPADKATVATTVVAPDSLTVVATLEADVEKARERGWATAPEQTLVAASLRGAAELVRELYDAENRGKAEPSGSTGTVPTIRSKANVPPMVSGSWPPEKLAALGNCSRTSSFLTSPRWTPVIARPV